MRELGPIQYRYHGSWFYPTFVCAHCGAALDKCDGVIVWDMALDDSPIYAACRGQCHNAVEEQIDSRQNSCSGWIPLEHFIGYITNNAGYEVAGKLHELGLADAYTLKRRKRARAKKKEK